MPGTRLPLTFTAREARDQAGPGSDSEYSGDTLLLYPGPGMAPLTPTRPLLQAWTRGGSPDLSKDSRNKQCGGG